MAFLILVRGLPGSGKTSLAKVLSEDGKYPVYSVDDYFTDPETGNYTFIYSENHKAYKQCELNCREQMKTGRLKIFIDNTFTLEWELEPYFKLASEFNYRVFVITVEHRHEGKNSHQITDDQLKKMAEKYKVVLL